MTDLLIELARMKWRVVFYPYGDGVACQLNRYGAERPYLWFAVMPAMPATLEKSLAQIVEKIRADAIPEDWWHK